MDRSEITAFIDQVTDSNMQRLKKLNEHQFDPLPQFSPFALCNRKMVTSGEQITQQAKMYRELVSYVTKVRFNLVKG